MVKIGTTTLAWMFPDGSGLAEAMMADGLG